VGDVIMEHVLEPFLAEVTWPWAPTERAIFGSSFFFGS